MVCITIQFDVASEDQREHIMNARGELSKAGVIFDSGYDLRENRIEWEFDESLIGAKVILRRT
jgi:hypothetical protein